MKSTFLDVSKALQKMSKPARAIATAKYLQVVPGGYGQAGDQFYGLTVPEVRGVAKLFRGLALAEVRRMFRSPVHEERLCASMIWSEQFRKGDARTKKAIYTAFLAGRRYMNNWDLIDGSAPAIVGGFLLDKKNRQILYQLARSPKLWNRRIAIVATQAFIKQGQFSDTIKLARLLLTDEHDLIHKASGWMLREMGKKDEIPLIDFLEAHAAVMPRTMLRYSLERLPPRLRADYMGRRAKQEKC